MIGKPQVAQLECEADEVSKEVGCVNATVNEDSAVDVRVGQGREGRRLAWSERHGKHRKSTYFE